MEAALREKKNALTKVEPVDPDLASISTAATRAKPLPCTMFACIRTTVASLRIIDIHSFPPITICFVKGKGS